MTRHARRVFLLGGWLLMQPPPVFKEGKTEVESFDFNAPMNRWTQKRAYDTAKECEHDREQVEQRNRAVLLKESTPENERYIAAMTAIDLAGRCVPAEHIYPPKECPPK